jgi:short chain dehydrogenase
MGWYMYGCVCRSAAVSFRGVGGIVWPDDPAADAVAAGRDAAVAGEGAVEGVFGGVAEGSGDDAANYLGTLRVTRALAPVLERNAPAAVVNILTLIALAPAGPMAGYSPSKAAAHSITQALRAELRDRGITVLGAYPGGIDTDMLAGAQGRHQRPWPHASSPPWPPDRPSSSPTTPRPAPDRSICPTRSSSSTC